MRSISNFMTRGVRERRRAKKTEQNEVKGMKEESEGKKVDQSLEIYMREREPCI